MHQIELRNIGLQYESAENPLTALQDVSFGVEAGNSYVSWVKAAAARPRCSISLPAS